jgi:hypothetical protein
MTIKDIRVAPDATGRMALGAACADARNRFEGGGLKLAIERAMLADLDRSARAHGVSRAEMARRLIAKGLEARP